MENYKYKVIVPDVSGIVTVSYKLFFFMSLDFNNFYHSSVEWRSKTCYRSFKRWFIRENFNFRGFVLSFGKMFDYIELIL